MFFLIPHIHVVSLLSLFLHVMLSGLGYVGGLEWCKACRWWSSQSTRHQFLFHQFISPGMRLSFTKLIYQTLLSVLIFLYVLSLQCLLHPLKFVNFLQSDVCHRKKCNSFKCVTCNLYRLFIDLRPGASKVAYSITLLLESKLQLQFSIFYSSMGNTITEQDMHFFVIIFQLFLSFMSPYGKGGRKEDAFELFHHLLDFLDEELLKRIAPKSNLKYPKVSPVGEIFDGRLQTTSKSIFDK